LTADELRAALADLPYWSARDRALSRSVALPASNLDRVLDRLERLRVDTGRGPRITRQTAASAVLTVRSRGADAVTAQDVELAHRVDAAIEEAGAGVAG
jgi:pterin-4a-carbinolamine dehydratase